MRVIDLIVTQGVQGFQAVKTVYLGTNRGRICTLDKTDLKWTDGAW